MHFATCCGPPQHAAGQHNSLHSTLGPTQGCAETHQRLHQPQVYFTNGQISQTLIILPIQIHSILANALIDSGATHNFISASYLSTLETQQQRQLWHQVPEPLEITLADQTAVLSAKQVTVPVRVGTSEQQVTFQVLEKLNYPVVLGMPWLVKANPTINWSSHQISLPVGGPIEPVVQPQTTTLCSTEAFLQVAKSPGARVFAIRVLPAEVGQTDHLADLQGTRGLLPRAKQLGMSASQTVVATPQKINVWDHICSDFNDVFELPSGLPPSREIEHRIDLLDPSAPVPNHRQYRMGPTELSEVQKQVEDLLSQGWIQPSYSQYNHPLLLVQKKDGSSRMCVDYRSLNQNTIIDRFPIPKVADIFDRLGKSAVFSKIDLAQGYHQVRITPGHEHRTAFQTSFGLFEYRVLPFGLNNAPATFQRLMNHVLGPNLNKFCTVYLDDILIFSRSPQEHAKHLRWVLNQLRKFGLKAKRKKCEFGLQDLEYLGHIVSKDGLKADPAKCTAIAERAAPKSIAELQTFLGMVTYYSKFIQNFATLAAPLYRLLRKNVSWTWCNNCQQAFRALQQALVSPPVLCMPDFTLPFQIETDASDTAIGAVLTQEQPDTTTRPIAYFSKILNQAQANYATHDKEMYAIYAACRHWRPYLQGQMTTIITDHAPLQHFLKQKELNKRQARWQRDLADTPITIVYRPGRQALVPDYLSRPKRGLPTMPVQPKHQQVNRGEPATHQHQMARVPQEFTAMATQSAPMINTVLVEPSFLARLSAAQVDENDKEMARYVTLARSSDVRFRFAPRHGVQLVVKTNEDNIDQLVIPASGGLRQLLLQELHDTPFGGHLGVKKLTHALFQRVWWPKLGESVRRFVQQCSVCARTKDSTQAKPGLLQPLPVPEKRFASWSLDFTTDLPSVNGFNTVLTCVDRLTKFVVLIPCSMGNEQLTAQETATLFFTHVVARFGVPREVLSDRDPRFTATFWKHIWQLLGTKTLYSTAFHPQTDGQTERTHRTIHQILRALLLDKDVSNWVSFLPHVAFAINSTINISTSHTPFELVYGENVTLPVDLAVDQPTLDPHACTFATRIATLITRARSAMTEAQRRQKLYYDKHRRDLSFSVGDLVYLSTRTIALPATTKRKLGPRWLGPFPVLARVGENAYRLGDLPSWLAAHPTFNITALKPIQPSAAVTPVPALADDTYEVERVLQERKRPPRFLVRWRGYGPEHDSWVMDMSGAPAVLAAWRSSRGRPTRSRS